MTDTLTELDFDVDIAPYEDDDNGDHKAHIVNPPKNTHIWQPGMEMQDVVTIARMNGIELVALCGYRWVPKRNPEKYDACEVCIEIAGQIMREMGE